jgi:hypothetical protein
MRDYLLFLKTPGAKSLLLAAFPARFAYGMIGLGLYFKVYHDTHSITVAGFAAGANGIAGSITTGMRAALLDKYGLKWPIRFFVPAYSISILLVNATHSKNLLILFAILLGLCAPPINLSVRPLWRSIVAQEKLRTAYAIDSTSMEIASILGPLAVTALALSVHPAYALALCSMALLIGGISISLLEVVDRWNPEQKNPSELRLFRIPGIRILAIEGLFIGLGTGIFSIALPAFTTIQHVPRMTALILTIQSSTMIIGSLVAGSIGKHWTPLQAFKRNYIFWTIAMLPLAFTTPGWSLMLVGGVMGLFVGAQQVFYLEILEYIRPKGAAASALGWMWMIEGSAGAVGSAIAGTLSESVGPQFCFALSSACVVAGAFITFGGQKYLQKANRKAMPTG